MDLTASVLKRPYRECEKLLRGQKKDNSWLDDIGQETSMSFFENFRFEINSRFSLLEMKLCLNTVILI